MPAGEKNSLAAFVEQRQESDRGGVGVAAVDEPRTSTLLANRRRYACDPAIEIFEAAAALATKGHEGIPGAALLQQGRQGNKGQRNGGRRSHSA